MAMLNVEIDTEKKTLAVKIDGKTLKNVRSVHAYISEYDDDELRLNICTKNMNEDETIEEYNMISLAEEGLVKQVVDKPSHDVTLNVDITPKLPEIAAKVGEFIKARVGLK